MTTQLPQKPRISITGFGPFLSHSYNPSWQVAQSFCAAMGDVFECRCECIDVTFAAARHFSARALEHADQRDSLTIHVGLSANAEALRFERFAYNRRGETPGHSEPGAAGPSDLSDALEVGGPAACETLINIDRLIEFFETSPVAQKSRLQACESRDPGDYVCNAIYYHSLRVARQIREGGRFADVLFIHIPRLDSRRAAQLGLGLADCVARYLKTIHG